VTVRDRHGKTAMHHCAANADEQVLEVLVSRDQSAVDTADNSGQTPLHVAVVAGNVKVVEALLKLGANVNAQDKERHSPAHWAVGRYLRRPLNPNYRSVLAFTITNNILNINLFYFFSRDLFYYYFFPSDFILFFPVTFSPFCSY